MANSTDKCKELPLHHHFHRLQQTSSWRNWKNEFFSQHRLSLPCSLGTRMTHSSSGQAENTTTRLPRTPEQYAQEHRIYNGNRKGRISTLLNILVVKRIMATSDTCTQKEDSRKLLPTNNLTQLQSVTNTLIKH